MVHSKTYGSVFHLLTGQCSMEIAVLLLLTVPLSTASPLRLMHRSNTDADTVQTSGVKRSKDTQEERVPALRIIPYYSEDKHLELDSLKLSENPSVRVRPRRTVKGGCQLGTCQLHNLANALFNLSKTNGKDESKKASDPQGYGR